MYWRDQKAFKNKVKKDTKVKIYNSTVGRHRRRWKDNIRMDLKEIGINTRN